MELRNFGHFHHIQAIKGGSVRKIMNVDFRRKPTIRFKNIIDIYGNGNAEHDVSRHSFQPRFVFGTLPFDCGPTESKSQGLPNGEKNIKIKAEAYESDCSGGDSDGGNDDLDGPIFINMTLKQIKEMCKAKKRKLSNYGDNGNETAKIVRREYPNSIPKDEECDLEETLSSWKFRLSKRRMEKKEHMKHCTSSLSQPTVSVVKCFQSDEPSAQANRNLVDHLNIKIEDFENDHPDCQVMTTYAGCSPVSTTQLSSGVGYIEMPETSNLLESQVPRSPTKEPQPCEPDYSDCQFMTACANLSLGCTVKLSGEMEITEVPETINVLKSQVQTSPTKQPQSCINGEPDEHMEHVDPNYVFDVCVSGGENVQVDCPGITNSQYSLPQTSVLGFEVPTSPTKQLHCCVKEVLNESRENFDPESIVDVDASGREIVKMDNPRVPTEQYLVLETNVSEPQVPIPLILRLPYCAVNEVSYEYREQDDPESSFNVDASDWEIMVVDSPAITSPLYSELPIAASDDRSCAIHALPYYAPPGTDNTAWYQYEACNTIQSHSPMKGASCQTSNYRQIHLPDMEMVDKFQCLEFSNRDAACFSVDCIKGGSSSNLKGNASNSSWNPNSYSVTDECLISVDQHSAQDKEKQSLYPDNDNGAKDSYTTSHSCNVSGELTTLVGAGDHRTELQHSPEKLLSKRKAISPSSQERLCKAMERTKLPVSGCKGKLYFSKQSNHRILRAEGLDQIRIAEVSDLCTKQVNRKPKCNKQSPNQNGIARLPNSSEVPRFSTGGASIEGCSQSAIEFSQRQMRDIEGLAIKLTKDLKSMKVIMKEVLDPEACPITLSNQNMDELRAAVENATKAEETVKKWISAMTRDCNRFCKLMRLIQKSNSSKEVVPKERKKITFADEAGGKLCHVKVFEDDTASLLESCTEQQELLVKL